MASRTPSESTPKDEAVHGIIATTLGVALLATENIFMKYFGIFFTISGIAMLGHATWRATHTK